MSDTGWRGRWFCFLDVVIWSRPGSRVCGGRVLVSRVVSPVSSRESWTVLGDDDAPVAPIERYLRYLTSIERSPNTVKAYAHDLKDWFTYLAGHDLDWQAASGEGVGGCVGGRGRRGRARRAHRPSRPPPRRRPRRSATPAARRRAAPCRRPSRRWPGAR